MNSIYKIKTTINHKNVKGSLCLSTDVFVANIQLNGFLTSELPAGG